MNELVYSIIKNYVTLNSWKQIAVDSDVSCPASYTLLYSFLVSLRVEIHAFKDMAADIYTALATDTYLNLGSIFAVPECQFAPGVTTDYGHIL